MTANDSPDKYETYGAIAEKRGIPIYTSNPSIPSSDAVATKRKRKRIGDEHKGLLIDNGTGEVLGAGAAVVYEWEEVDDEQFVKLFLGGVKKASGLSKAGHIIFEALYHQMRFSPNTDRVELSYWTAQQHVKSLNERTYRRGLRDLLEREILYRSPTSGLFFVDMNCMFNGNRLAFVKGYHRKGSPKQPDMFAAQPLEIGQE